MMSTVASNVDLDEFNSSILEFLNKERECFSDSFVDGNSSEIDVESIFEEINRLSDKNDERSVDEILREAEFLMKNQQHFYNQKNNQQNFNNKSDDFKKVFDEVSTISVLSDESTPHVDDSQSENEDETDTIEEMAEGIETIQLNLNQSEKENEVQTSNEKFLTKSSVLAESNQHTDDKPVQLDLNNKNSGLKDASTPIRTIKNETSKARTSPLSQRNDYKEHRRSFDRSSIPSPINQNSKTFSRPSSTQSTYSEKNYANRLALGNNNSPIQSDSAVKESMENIAVTREHALKIEIEQLQEKLKDTEERLQSLKIQHDSLSQIHRDLRDNHTQVQEESEHLKLDVQHLTECANVLRSELQSARNDRSEALEIQKTLQTELTDCRNEKKKILDQTEKDCKTIQDLRRQCKEMERILIRKQPDSVSALIVSSKNPSRVPDDSSASRRLLEQRIAQLESDAREQDKKAQKILANVQAKFYSVQSKYETHIADLETQVLSLQEINTKLNEKIEFQIATLNNFAKSNNHFKSSCTQTDDVAEREGKMIEIATQTDLKLGAKLNVNTPTGAAKKTPSKIPSSHSEMQISAHHLASKEDAHLLATIRGMRVDLAIKDKAMQRLTRELDECKKTIRKLQKEKEAIKLEKPNTFRKYYDPHQYSEQQQISLDNQALKEASNKIKLLECDYKALHDKRLQDLKTLQAAHERELSSCHETVRILQQRLTERDEAFANQKRRKIPIDYYALKAKVTSLERRHSEREERLHLLVEALSKGRLNGALDEILKKNDQ